MSPWEKSGKLVLGVGGGSVVASHVSSETGGNVSLNPQIDRVMGVCSSKSTKKFVPNTDYPGQGLISNTSSNHYTAFTKIDSSSSLLY